MKQAVAHNPIKSGFYPDPSICRVGEDFYLVNSSFAYFPGVPIFHSKDLANWEQIGNILDRNEQIPLMGCGHSQGIYAPTLRYYDGVFYMITTNVSAADSLNQPELGGNFIVTATNPAGPWSKPYFLGKDAQGIDPSLFFDDDGTCYFCGTRPNHNGEKFSGDWEIWVQKLDVETMQLTGGAIPVWNGAMRDVIWPEGPHIYKINDWYYLMHAEGGTGPDHCIAVARSKNIFGPYKGYPSNPVLTHRHLGKAYPIRYVGHGDLVNVPAEMTVSGEEKWYISCLASRPCDGYTLMGRETFLAEVTWEDGWPVVNPGIGKLTDELIIDLPVCDNEKQQTKYTFNTKTLPAQMLMLRNPDETLYSLTDNPGFLRMPLKTVSLQEQDTPSFVGLRQTAFSFKAFAGFQFLPKQDGETAGLSLMQSNQFHFKLQIVRKENMAVAQAVMVQAKEFNGTLTGDGVKAEMEEEILAETSLGQANEITDYITEIKVDGIHLAAYVEVHFKDNIRNTKINLSNTIGIEALSSEIAGGFVGNVIGIFTYSPKETDTFADFEWFMVE